MIHRLSANKPSFRTLSFKDGLNVIVAEREDESTEKDTRNGLGKSMLIEIIDFCLGSRAIKGKGLIIEPLEEWAFTLELTLNGQRLSVTRAISAPNRIKVNGNTDGWPIQPEVDNESGEKSFKADWWRSLLGWAFFNIHRNKERPHYRPSYRSLISYFVRRGPDAYASPFRHFRQQKTWDVQLHSAYLLGLNWEYAARWQELKDREQGVKAIEQAIKSGAMEGAIGTVGELETRKIQLEEEVNETREALDSFKVHEQYESIQMEADRLTEEIHELGNANVADRRRLSRYHKSIQDEKQPSVESVERLYKDAGIVFPEGVKRTLDEAKAFHRDLVTNRKEFLQSEVNKINFDIEERDKQIKLMIDERAKYLQVLQSHGALQEMTELQEHHVSLQGELDRVKSRLAEIKNLKSTKREVKVERAELVKSAERDYEERREIWSFAVRGFNEHSQALYKSPGNLIIDIDDSGYRYSVDIERGGSEGIDKMKIFCFDLAVLQLQISEQSGIDFLIHDTLMYDSVDPRQRARALERAQGVCSEIGGQYICTMNSDMVPHEHFSQSFDFDKHVRMTLTDRDPTGSLFGFRFERPTK